MKNFCKVSVEGLKFVDSMVTLAGFVEENRMDRGGWNVVRERKRSRLRSFLYQKRSEQREQKMNISPCSSRGQQQGAAIAGYVPWSTSSGEKSLPCT
jgi:hypothetical protein